MTWCIEENDLTPERGRFLVGNANFVGANMLRDSACFAFGNGGFTNRIQQRGCAVVDMAHDGDHRRTRRYFNGGLFSTGAAGSINIFRSLLFERNHVGFGSEEAGHFTRQFSVERLVDGRKNAATEQTRN